MVTPNRTNRFKKQIRQLKRDNERRVKAEQKTIITEEEDKKRIEKLKEEGIL